MEKADFESTKEIPVPQEIVDQVIGQEEAVEVIRKAAKQRRHLLLIGDPGTGKSMLGLALSRLLPKEKLVDVLVFPNPYDENQPLIRTVPGGKGRELTMKSGILPSNDFFRGNNLIMLLIALAISLIPYYFYANKIFPFDSPVIYAASMITGVVFLIGVIFILSISKRMGGMMKTSRPKVIVDNFGKENAPFWDATGAHAGALLGDVMHDPLQCILPEEKVFLPNGKPVQISEIVDPYFSENETGEKDASFSVLTGDDQHKCFSETSVTKVFCRKITEDIVSIKTRKGYTLNVTKNHPVAVFSEQGRIEYIPAGALHKGMFSVVPYKFPGLVTEKINNNLLMFLADGLADGYFGQRSVAFRVRTSFKRETFERDIKNIGFNAHTIRRGRNIDIHIHSAEFLRKLRKLGIQINNKKQLPPILFNLNNEQISLFLTRYISLDGYVNYQGQFELISKELIPDITALLLKIGIKAKIVPRIDPGFGKEKRIIQQRIRFNDFSFAQFYEKYTINPKHKKNLKIYFSTTNCGHVTYDDVVPLNFESLEKIRERTGLSKNSVHKNYYSLASHTRKNTSLTRQLLSFIIKQFGMYTNCPSLSELKEISEGSYAYDEIVEVKSKKYSGKVYNLTTAKGTYLANFILTHNSGGLGTPAHERVVAGMMHKAHMGVLFVDEIAILQPSTQQELLTALQEGKFPITGQSERSSGAMVRTEPAPCDFILVAAGNAETIEKMHPALRSRIRGYGYEIYMNDTMVDTEENRKKLMRFVAQEVLKDKKIPHFSKEAVDFIIEEARKMANRKGHLTLRLRELGGLVRAAGDLAVEEKKETVGKEHVIKARKIARTLEHQMADKFIERKKEYELIKITGEVVGRVNGLAVMGGATTYSGIILPIEAEVTRGNKEKEVVATGKLGVIAKEAIKNVTAVIKKLFDKDMSEYEIYVQFLQTYEGVEGDSASVAVATAIISSLNNLPVRQDTAMTGSLSVLGEVLPIGGVSAKIEAAIEVGLKRVIIPESNFQDIVIDKEKLEKIKVIPVNYISEVLKEVMDWKGKTVKKGK